MGVSIHYRGQIANPNRIEDFEDRILDLALDFGAHVRIWRSAPDHDPWRLVRGVVLNLVPGQDTTSLLVSPEGFLIPLLSIKDAEWGRVTEAPWCSVKTQFGDLQGHVMLIELLDSLKREFFPGLEVIDEAGYWESRDLNKLRQKRNALQQAIDSLAEQLCRTGLSPEAAEDPEILASRIERVAQLVRQRISRPSEHAPVDFDHPDEQVTSGNFGTEAQWDAFHKQQRRRQERLSRVLDERQMHGELSKEDLEDVMREQGLLDWHTELSDEDLAESQVDSWSENREEDEASFGEQEDEDWRESLTDTASENDSDFEAEAIERRQLLQQRASSLMSRLCRLAREDERLADPQRHSHLPVLMGGAGELLGGLALALGSSGHSHSGWDLVQLKRALRGAAFARAALVPLRADRILSDQGFRALAAEMDQLTDEIHAELNRLRHERDE